jgi:hypothetical protein
VERLHDLSELLRPVRAGAGDFEGGN